MQHPFVLLRTFIAGAWDDSVVPRTEAVEKRRRVKRELREGTSIYPKEPTIFELEGHERFVCGMSILLNDEFSHGDKVYSAGYRFIVKSSSEHILEVHEPSNESLTYLWQHEHFQLEGVCDG